MPRNQFQRMFFAFVTVVITVHAYVFYSLYVVNGSLLMNLTRAVSSVPLMPRVACICLEGCSRYGQ